MQEFNPELLKKLYIPLPSSHKGQNGKLLIVGGSHLFHASTLWALEVASRIVDMVFYASIPENNEIVRKSKELFRNGIVIPQEKIEDYIDEADAILIGPGMLRSLEFKIQSSKSNKELPEILKLENEGEQTYWLTKYLLNKYPEKKWVIDAGALQMLEPEWLLPLKDNVVITPHPGEFESLKFRIQNSEFKITIQNLKLADQVKRFAKEYNCVVLLKGEEDVVCSANECCKISGGNPGMTKGGTGDVLAGLVASLATKNDLYLSAICGSYINKKAGERLFEKVSYYFNSTDLVNEIPVVMKELLNS